MVRLQLIFAACLLAGCFEPGTDHGPDADGGAGTDAGGAGTGGAGAGGTGGTSGSGGAADDACTVDSDCGWGEIDHEILSPTDCICLFGCPFLPQNVETIARRNEQHAKLCDPQFDGMGQPCPIDDCAMPPPAVCLAGSCGAAPFGGP